MESILDLSTCKTADDVRALAEAYYLATHPLAPEPERPALHRPIVVSSQGKGRLWFEVVFDRHSYRSESGAEIHLRSFNLDNDAQLDIDELQSLQEQLTSALDAYTALKAYGEARKAWLSAQDEHKKNQRLFVDTRVTWWANEQKKK